MCGRYDNLIARDAYRGLFKANRLPKSNFPLRYNIAPTDPMVRWGVPADTKRNLGSPATPRVSAYGGGEGGIRTHGTVTRTTVFEFYDSRVGACRTVTMSVV